jgi:6-phosphogluconate dehydrogenase
MNNKSDIGILGLGPKGQGLARNFAGKGFRVVILNPNEEGEESLLETFIGDYEGDFVGTRDLSVFVELLDRPRLIQLMTHPGSNVDELIQKLIPLLDDGDLIVDGSDSNYRHTSKRVNELKSMEILYVGMGLSGSSEHMLTGPSIMAGGNHKAKELIFNMYRSVASGTEKPDLLWTGHGGSAHFARMLQNGLEASEMQLMAEAYSILRGLSHSRDQIAEIMDDWNQSIIGSYLMKITADILIRKNNEEFVIDQIADQVAIKDPDGCLVISALEAGIPVPTIQAALDTRTLSRLDKRTMFRELYNNTLSIKSKSKNKDIESLKQAILSARLIFFGQGIELLKSVSRKHEWNTNIPELLNLWSAASIIQCNLLETITEAASSLETPDFLCNNPVKRLITESFGCLSKTVALGASYCIPLPVMSSAFQYLNCLSSKHLYQNIIQAQEDYYSGEGYELKDRPGKLAHTDWTG